MAVINPPGYLHNLTTHTAQVDRLAGGGGLLLPDAVGSLRPVGGVRTPSDYVVAYTTGTDVTVSAGLAYVPQGQSNLGGAYTVPNDGTVTFTLGARHATLTRFDLIAVRVQDAFYSGAANTADIFPVAGTAASTPADPTLPAGASYLVVARVTVPPSGALTVTRLAKVVSVPGGIQPLSAADPTAPLFDGQYRDDATSGLQRGIGGVWTNQLGAGPWVDFPVVGAPFFDHYVNPAQGGGTGGAPKVQMRIEPGRRVACRGMAVAASAAGPGGIYTSSATIPIGWRPPNAITFIMSVILSGGGLGVYRLELSVGGILYVMSNIAANTYFPMNQMSWELS